MKKYSEYEINKLIKNKHVHYVREDRLEFTLPFKKMMYEEWKKYKNISCLRNLLIKHGIDIKIVTREYLKDRQKDFKRNGEPVVSFGINRKYKKEIIDKYKEHPYIRIMNKNQICFIINFYNETYLIHQYFDIKKILEIYEIDYNDFCEYTLFVIERHYKNFNKINSDIEPTTSKQLIRIEINKQKILEEIIDVNFNKMKDKIKQIDLNKKKENYIYLQQIPKDNKGKYTKKYIFNKLQISKTSYYKILNSDEYFFTKNKKDKQDDLDIQKIHNVNKYIKYPLGTRMMTMYLKILYNETFNRKKVQRLYRKYNIDCKVRKYNKMKTVSNQFIKNAVKPNLIQRKFRIARPYNYLLTDVTYLKYDNKTAYLAPIKDSVTGKILSFEVSINNNVDLAIRALKQLDTTKLNKKTIIHSDQGYIYLNHRYQLEVEKMNLIQSMSKRGSCWDNASMESFFGHLKDECIYSNCKTIFELKAVIAKYIDYYNNFRPQWNRKKTTPNLYERYLLSLSKESYKLYLDNEVRKYVIMKKKSEEKLIKLAKNNKELRSRYGI